MNEQLMLDGNAVAGLLSQIFAFEPTTAYGTCESCGATDYIGATHAYIHAPGTIVRCAHCENILMVVVHQPGKYILALPGIRWLEIRE